jgi:WD40 repeat protein
VQISVEKIATLAGHRDCVYTLEKSDQPNIFYSAGGDGMVAKWDLKNPDIGTLLVKVPRSIYALCFIPELNQLVVGQNFEGIHIIDLNTNKEIRSLKTDSTSIFDIKYYEGKLLVCQENGVILVIQYDSLEILRRIHYSTKSARALSINIGCKEFAVGYSDNFIRVFDLEEYKLKYEFKAHENSVFTVQYSPDSRFLLSGSRDAKLKMWDVFNGYSLHEQVVAHMYAINNLAFSPDNDHFVTCSMDKTIKLWRVGEIKLLKVIDKARHAGHATSVNRVLWTNYQNQLISCSDDKMISVWKIAIDDNI